MELDSPQLYYCLLPFTTISIVLYTQVLIELFRKRGLEAYDGFFYRMICSQSIYDISYVIMYFVIEIPKDWPTLLPGMNGTILHQVLYTHAHLCHFAQMLGVTMMAVTRMLHVCHPSHDFTSALQNLGVWKVALFHSILPVIYGIYMLVGQDWVTQYFVKHAARVTRGAAAESIVTNSNILCVCAVSCALVSASCYIYVFLTLRERPDRSSRDETTIQVTSLVLFFALCTLAAYFVCNLLSFGTDFFYTMRKHFYAFSFFISLASPWCLVVTSESIRSSVIRGCLPTCVAQLPLCSRRPILPLLLSQTIVGKRGARLRSASMLFAGIHYLFMTVGIGINALTLLVISLRTQTSIKDYSIVLFNTALNDLTAMSLHFLLNARFFVNGGTVIQMADGPCRMVSDVFCSILFEVIHDTIMHSCALIGISFWYRRRALRYAGPVGWCRLQTIMLLSLSVHLPRSIAFYYGMASLEDMLPIIAEVYGPEHYQHYAISGLLSVDDPLTRYVFGHNLFFPSIMYTYIFFTRRSVITRLNELASKMSQKTHGMHQSLVKVLSIHALLPGCAIFSFLILFFQMTGYYHSIEVETLEYTIALLPAIVNPVLTLLFIDPYRSAVQSLVGRKKSSISKLPHSSMTSSSVTHPSVRVVVAVR